VPNIFPMIVLMKPVFAVCAGGGGITADETAPAPPLSRRRMSCVELADGGGATTDGAGIFKRAFRPVSFSGAETGGGTTAALFICTRDGATSWPTAFGAGGITVPARAGEERERSLETRVDAGPTTFAVNDGAERLPSRATLGAGAIMLLSNTGV
jgi:hypothetical protein